MWVRADGAFAAIVAPDVFYTAQGIIQERKRKRDQEVMAGQEQALLAVQPCLLTLPLATSTVPVARIRGNQI